MAKWDGARLTKEQSGSVVNCLGDPELLKDLSWDLATTKVLHVRSLGGDFVVKAAPPEGTAEGLVDS